MDCLQAKKLISIYIDGQLNNKQEAYLTAHLKQCPNCQKIYEGYLKTWESLSNFKPIEPPSNFNAIFWERVKQQEHKSWVGNRVFVFPTLPPRLAYALASIMIIIGLIFIFQVKQEKQLNNLAQAFKSAEEIEMVKHFDVLKDFEVVQNLELLENYEDIENLEETTSI